MTTGDGWQTDDIPGVGRLGDWLGAGVPPDGLDTEAWGWSYQAASDEARKGRALVQTPGFVRDLILDLTLGDVLSGWNPAAVRLIDPSCGCGHFLVDGLRRTYVAWMGYHPGDRDSLLDEAGYAGPRAPEEAPVARSILERIVGVDLDPACVSIARARLILEARRLTGLPLDFRPRVYRADSLLHGRPRPGDDERFGPWPYDADSAREALRPGYSVVVGNPPYVTGKDAALRDAYRERYDSAHGSFSLALPFTELMFGLAGGAEDPDDAGFLGMITTNAFMKREYGRKFVEGFVPTVDLTHVLDTSGAYIPGHGTPTVILCGRGRRPQKPTVFTVMGIRGEPTTPADPAAGLVWREIAEAARSNQLIGAIAAARRDSPRVVSARTSPRDLFDLMEVGAA